MVTRATSVALAAVVVLTACSDPSGLGPNPQDHLLFVSSRVSTEPGNWVNLPKDIFRMDVNGESVTNLTDAPAAYRSLSLSADGSTVSYIRLTGCYAAWVMNADGSGAREVAGFSEFRCIHRPRISPDGSRIALTTSRSQLGWEVWVVNTDGGNATDLSSAVGRNSWVSGWSPDGRVVFHDMDSATGEPIHTYILNADGSGLELLFDRAGDHSPAWSPDGSRIAFISDRDGTSSVYVMNADGTGVRRVSDLPGVAYLSHPLDINENAFSPWSPDGTRIVFRNLVNSTNILYSVRADGTGLTPLTAASLNARFNGWSRGGQWIAFTSSATGVRDIYIMEPDGSGMRNLTASAWHDSDAVWLPAR